MAVGTAPEITVGAALAAGAESKPKVIASVETRVSLADRMALAKGAGASVDARLVESHNLVDKLRKYGKKGHEGFEALREGRKEKRFTADDGTALRELFGNGEAELNTTTKTVEYTGTGKEKSDIAKRESLAASETIGKQITTYLRYAELADGYNTATDKADFLKRNGIDDVKTWDTMRKEAIGFVLKSGNLEAAMPELKSLTPEQRLDYIEQTLALDPELNKVVKERMQDIYQKAKLTKKAEYSDPQLDTDIKAKDRAETGKTDARKKIDDVLTSLGTTGLTFDKARLTGLIEARMTAANGFNSETVLASVRQSLIVENGLQPIAAFKEVEAQRQQLKVEQAVAQKAINEINAEISGYAITPDRRHMLDAQLRQLTDDQHARDVIMLPMEQRYEAFDKARKAEPSLEGRYDSIMQGTQAGTGGQPAGEIALHMREYSFNAKNVSELEAKIELRERELNKSGDEQLAIRMKEEAEWTESMEGIMPDAVAEVLMKRRDRLAEMQTEKMSDETKGKFAKLQEAIDKNWISRNPKTRNRKIEWERIKDDVQMMIYLGPENGLRQLVTRDMAIEKLDPTTGKAMFDGKGKLMLEEDYSKLTDEQKALVDEACNGEMGEAYKQRLFTDFLTARGIGGLKNQRFDIKIFGHGWENTLGTLALKSHEEDALEQQYGSYLNAFADATPKGQKIADELKQQGYNKVKDHKKWLAAFIAAMIGIPVAAIGVAMTGGLGGVAMVAGSAVATGAGGLRAAGTDIV